MISRKLVQVPLPIGLAQEIDSLVEGGEFTSRSEALKFGARLVVLLSKRTHRRAEDYAYSEIREGLLRGQKSHVS